MIPKEILKYSLKDWFFTLYPDGFRAVDMLRQKEALFFYSYFEDSCYRIEKGRIYKKYRGRNPELISSAEKGEPIDEYSIGAEKFESEIGEKKTVAISRDEYDKFSTVYTPWGESLYRLLFDECTADPAHIDYQTLRGVFYDGETPAVKVLNDAREILGLPLIKPSDKHRRQ